MCNYYDKQTEIPTANDKAPPSTTCIECGDPLNFDERASKVCLACQNN
jgi:hypothetical protein